MKRILLSFLIAFAAICSPATGQWTLKFGDEFRGSYLNGAKWSKGWFGQRITPPVNSLERNCYDPKQVRVTNGELRITAIRKTETCGWRGTVPYTSGLISTNGKFEFTYGIMKARIWTPPGQGVWPAWWANGHHHPHTGEIDVLEALRTDWSHFHFHYAGCGGECNPGGSVLVPGATQGWHTYAARWAPGQITWNYDGKRVWQFTGPNVTSAPMYMILNLGIRSTDAPVPATLRVDWVRLWQRS